MAQLGNLIVNGVTRLLSKLYVNGSVTAPEFIGKLTGKADTAGTADKLSVNGGSATQPVYFSDGKPVATTYGLNKTVPADAKFTDTNTWRGIQNNLTSTSTTDSLSAAQGKALKELVDGKAASSHTHTKSQITDFPTSMPASDVKAWAKADTKPSYAWSEITDKPSTFAPASHTHTMSQISDIGNAAGKTVRTLTKQGPSGWTNATTDQKYVPDMAFIAYWNGAYSGAASNLAYCNKGAFGTAATKNTGDFATASHTHNYAGSASAGGSATSAVKLDTDTAGSATQPVYFSGGKPTACTYSLGKTVPSDAKFTDTTYSTFKGATSTADGGSGLVPAPTKGNQTKYLRADGTWQTPPDTNTTYSNMTAATGSTAGKAGLVPAPAAGAQGKFLRGDGTWQTPTNTWRGIQNSLTSDSTTDSLSAAQGKALKTLVDGKAPSSHTHTKGQITDFPTSLKNPTSLTIQTNGTQAAVYDGSAAKVVNITKDSIGLGSVDNTADADKSVKHATSADSANKAATADNSSKTNGYKITAGTTDLTAGESTLESGTIYFVYE